MKILITDDDDQRSFALKKYISSNCLINPDDIHIAICLSDARELLRNLYFDVLVLDVVLPKRKDKLKPNPAVGIGLLRELNRQTFLKKPEKIIGITAHLEDAASFRAEFELSCNIVVETVANSDAWKLKIANSLSYTGISKTSRAVSNVRTSILTVHGIRTFGKWQLRFRKLVEERTADVSFHNYKFGYFSSLFFIFPFFRYWQMRRLKKRIIPIIESDATDRLFIFCHSFGTYLVAISLLSIFREKKNKKKILLVLCGSVLPSNFDWSLLDDGSSIKVINECGDGDYVLWLSAAFLPGVGMAGKVGFYGFNGEFVMNRFFRGGHSLYFEDSSFMAKHWLPLLDESPMMSEIDERENKQWIIRLCENIVTILSFVKSWVYIFAVIIGVGLFMI